MGIEDELRAGMMIHQQQVRERAERQAREDQERVERESKDRAEADARAVYVEELHDLIRRFFAALEKKGCTVDFSLHDGPPKAEGWFLDVRPLRDWKEGDSLSLHGGLNVFLELGGNPKRPAVWSCYATRRSYPSSGFEITKWRRITLGDVKAIDDSPILQIEQELPFAIGRRVAELGLEL